jgi:DNA-binding transcriptional LysR family regulator
MELRQLQYFIAVAEERHFGHAADRENLTQAALSQQVQRLERELGVQLFNRTTRLVELTGVGRLFLQEARIVLARTQRAADTVRRARSGDIGQLVVGYPSTGRGRWASSLLRSYCFRFPGINVAYVPARPADLLAELRRERIDVAFLHCDIVVGDDLALRCVAQHPYLLVLPIGHKLLNDGEVSVAQLAAERILLFPRQLDPGHYDDLVRALTIHSGGSPTIRGEACTAGDLIDSVEAGRGVALIAESDMEYVAVAGVEVRRISAPVLSRPLSLVWRRAGVSPPLAELLKTVEEELITKVRGNSSSGHKKLTQKCVPIVVPALKN